MSMFAIENGDLVGGFTQLDCMLDLSSSLCQRLPEGSSIYWTSL